MNRILTYCSLLAVAIVQFACKTSQPVKPIEEYQQYEIEEKPSSLNIPIKINIKELEASLNKQLTNPLYKDSLTTDGDNMAITANKKEDISITIDSQMVTYRVPLALDIKYDIGFTDVNAFGEIALVFKTAFNILETWELETSTILEDYQWLQTPKVKLAGINLPVGFIANVIINQSREVLTASIDEQVKTNFNFKKVIEDTWEEMFNPMLVSEQYNTWLNINPLDIGMTPIKMDRDTMSSVIIVQSKPKISLGEKPAPATWRPLPLFKYRNFQSESFVLSLSTDVSYEEAERISKEQILGETFSQGNRSVTIEDLELYGKGEKLVVNTKLSGSYNGNIYLAGKPVFNKRKNSIDIKNLDFTLDTKNFLLKSAGWLAKSTIKNQIQDNLDFLLDYNITEVEQQIKSQLADFPLSEGINLNGSLASLNIANAYLTPQGMRVIIELDGKLGVYVTGFAAP